MRRSILLLPTYFMFLLFLFALWQGTVAAAEPASTLTLWPAGEEPGVTRVDRQQGERLVTDRRRTFNQYTNISVPQVAVFPAADASRTGAAVLVLPGGGMQRLAYEHEGLEIADWLNPQGITVFVLKYRVPAPSSTALLDAQRALGLIRHNAQRYQIDPDRIGVMGFSAGGEVALLLATNYVTRGYDAIDEADKTSCRPDHICLVYPGGLIQRNGNLRSDIADKLSTESTPPVFIVHAFADASMNSLALAVELKRNRIPTEMHIYQEGGHGFGARDSALPLSGWKQSYLQWIEPQGFLDPPFVSDYAADYVNWHREGAQSNLPTLTTLQPSATLADAFAVQREAVRSLAHSDRIIGFKSGGVSDDPFDPSRPAGPVTGALFQSGRLSVSGPVELHSDELGPVAIETELGFLVSQGLEISTRLANVPQAKGAFESIVKVIEIPRDLKTLLGSDINNIDMVAVNVGSNRTLVAGDGVSPDDYAPGELSIVLTRDGRELHRVEGDTIEGGLWERLVIVVNRIVDQGYMLRSGDMVISGALGVVHPAEPGHYVADYGKLGKIEFTID